MPALSISAHTRLVVLLGDPVGHSRSPELHNAAFAAAGLDYAYLACRVAPDALGDAVRGLRALGIAGANVTIPHKQAIVPYLDDCTRAARGVGAVNTVVVESTPEGPRLVGDNTDVGGFLDGLAPHADALRGSEILVWGAGGAARAVVYALLTTLAPSRLTLVARRVEQATALAADFAALDPHGALGVASFGDAAARAPSARLLVNTTPLGMHPHPDATPYPEANFTTGQVVYDLVYRPEQTRLLREAAAAGAGVVTGRSMFHGQAARAFERWTGVPMPDVHTS